jgi:hypothetical protein
VTNGDLQTRLNDIIGQLIALVDDLDDDYQPQHAVLWPQPSNFSAHARPEPVEVEFEFIKNGTR